MTLEQALAIIDSALEQIPALRQGRPFSAAHVAFVQNGGLNLARIFGPTSTVTKNFGAIKYQSTGSYMTSLWTYKEDAASRAMGAFQQGLELAEGILTSARQQLVEHGADEVLRGTRIRADGAKVFVSHGTETSALNKVERFLRALGTQPVIVMRGPSKGLAVDDLVEQRMDECDCAVILATADEEVAGRRQPRPNVLHEIGLAQEKLDNRIIYLKEDGCDFPSNVAPKIWETFVQGNMEAAFEKISKELHSFGFI
jgi:predicted nucleotide-binding protein